MTSWSLIYPLSIPVPNEWVVLQNRMLFFSEDGIFMMDEKNKVYFRPVHGLEDLQADEKKWAWRIGDDLFWGEVDTDPTIVEVPTGHQILDFNTNVFITRYQNQKYCFDFHSLSKNRLPNGCKQFLLYEDVVYWNSQGVIYSWKSGSTQMVAQSFAKVASFLVGPNNWIAINTENEICLLHQGKEYIHETIEEIIFHPKLAYALVLKQEEVFILNLNTQQFVKQDLPPTLSLVGFEQGPLVLGLEHPYIFTPSLYLAFPKGVGPELSYSSVVTRNQQTIFGLSGSLWGWDKQNDTIGPIWICDLPDYEQVWVSNDGYVFLDEQMLFWVSNNGSIEVIEEQTEFDSSQQIDVIEVEELGRFVHSTTIEKTPSSSSFVSIVDSLYNWSWNEEGLWVIQL